MTSYCGKCHLSSAQNDPSNTISTRTPASTHRPMKAMKAAQPKILKLHNFFVQIECMVLIYVEDSVASQS